MAVVPQINNPITGKNYTSSANLANKQDSEGLFDIIELTKPVVETKSSTDSESGGRRTTGGSKDFLPMSVKIAKDPTMAVESLKQLIGDDLINTAKANGYTELEGELDNLTKSLFLKPEEVLGEILLQEKQNTTFRDSAFFDLLRGLITKEGANKAFQGANGETAPPYVPNDEQLINNPHIHSLNSNITPSEDAKFDSLRVAVGNILKAINYAENKNEILTALSSNLKFLSSFFAPNKPLSEQLGLLSNEWLKSNAGEKFDNLKNDTLLLLKTASESLLNNEQTQVLIPLIIHNISRYNTNEAVLNDYFAQLMVHISNTEIAGELEDTFKNLMSNLFNSNVSEDFEQSVSNTSNDTINQPINQEQNTNFYKDSDIFKFLSKNLVDLKYLAKLELDEEAINSPTRSFLLGKIDGKTAVFEIISKLVSQTSVKDLLADEISRIDNISYLVDYLNNVLQSIPDIPARQAIYEGLVEIINNMAETNELPPEPPEKPENLPPPDTQSAQTEKQSTIKQLIDFIEKNIDHSALKTINNYNASNLLQSLINAPGVFTPLAHYIVPLQIENTQAFGELWVDNNEKNSGSADRDRRTFHLFLTFDIEKIGRFEVDMVAVGQEVNLSLLYPETFKEKVAPLTKKVNKLVVQSGYTPRKFTTGILKKPHNLIDVFPTIIERRMGFNVKA